MTDDLSNNELCFKWIVSFIFCYLGRKTLPVASSSSSRMAWWWRLCRLKPSVTRSCLTQCLIRSTSLVRTCKFMITHSTPQWLHQFVVFSEVSDNNHFKWCNILNLFTALYYCFEVSKAVQKHELCHLLLCIWGALCFLMVSALAVAEWQYLLINIITPSLRSQHEATG